MDLIYVFNGSQPYSNNIYGSRTQYPKGLKLPEDCGCTVGLF